jgi:hypothetical protein
VASDRRRAGGAANYTWNRAAGSENLSRLTAEEEHELYLDQLGNSFWCDTCGSSHPLREHAQCRKGTQPETPPPTP